MTKSLEITLAARNSGHSACGVLWKPFGLSFVFNSHCEDFQRPPRKKVVSPPVAAVLEETAVFSIDILRHAYATVEVDTH